MYKRIQEFQDSGNESLFLWGARQTGKSTLLRTLFPDALFFDLLLSDVYGQLLKAPQYLREAVLVEGSPDVIIIDEVQRIPSLLNEVHWLIENTNKRFILCGSSPRKIIRGGHNLLGGRALRYELLPLVSTEIPDMDLIQAINSGLIPRHYLSKKADVLVSGYIGTYLQEEIQAEARIRNVASFARFLEAAAFSNGEIVNYTNIASDCGVSAPTVKEYFHILEDTLTGRFLPSFTKKPKRRVIQAPKFYYFDLGVANTLLKRGRIAEGSETFGHAFEHFIYQELYAHNCYSGLNYPMSYWRTASGIEVDFILGDHKVAIEVKAVKAADRRHIKGLTAFAEEYKTEKLIVVSNDPIPRRLGKVDILPWRHFLNALWEGRII